MIWLAGGNAGVEILHAQAWNVSSKTNMPLSYHHMCVVRMSLWCHMYLVICSLKKACKSRRQRQESLRVIALSAAAP